MLFSSGDMFIFGFDSLSASKKNERLGTLAGLTTTESRLLYAVGVLITGYTFRANEISDSMAVVLMEVDFH
jgi:hypothetical protein